MADTLYVLRPGFTEEGRRWFCPYSAQVVGFLAYYPQVRATIELVELEFPKPRHPLVDVLGPEHQAAPMLVLAGKPAAVEGVVVGTARGVHFVAKTVQILRYLAATRNVPAPH